MTQRDIFTDTTEVSLSKQLFDLAGPNCLASRCDFLVKSIDLLEKRIKNAGYSDTDNANEIVAMLIDDRFADKNIVRRIFQDPDDTPKIELYTDSEPRRLAGNIVASKEKCRGQYFGKCALGISE